MGRIQGSDTTPETVLRQELWARGLRYRLHERGLPGRPDLVFRGPRVTVFIDGCFWHGCPEHYVRPRSRREFWSRKLRENVERDQRQTLELESRGWTVLRYWEHEVFVNLLGISDEVEAAVRGTTIREETGVRRDDWRVLEASPLQETAGENCEMERWVLTDLRHPETRKTIERERRTTKW
jgi:DNA mismatch endonuclease (patch repair protein)